MRVRSWDGYLHGACPECESGGDELTWRTCRALQLHPNEPALFVYAAQQELENLSPAAARALLQRGIRLNKEHVPLWIEYVKFELGFVEGLRRRWDVLGVGSEDVLADSSEEARKEIMQGAIVKAVISEAAKGVCYNNETGVVLMAPQRIDAWCYFRSCTRF